MKLELKNITKLYDKKIIVENVDLHANEGELISILGPSGAGKTTILKIISGLLKPDGGRVLINGIDVTDVSPEKRGVAYVFQEPLLFPHMTVEENICFGMKIQKWSKVRIKQKLESLIDLMQLKGLEKRYPSMISGGQQQRVSIARSIAIEPCILLMDEPFSSLDPGLRHQMGELIKHIKKDYHLTIIFVTHDRNESMSLSDRIAVLLKNTIVQAGTSHNIYYKPQNRAIASFLGEGNFIQGSVQAGRYTCDFGTFDTHLENGSTTLFLRPHSIKLNTDIEKYPILKVIPRGKEVLYEIDVNGKILLAEGYADMLMEAGQKVDLVLPHNNLHFIKDY